MARAIRRDAVRNRQRLVDAAIEAFTTAGANVSLESVATRAGVSIGTLYNHFPDRGALVDAVVGEVLERLLTVADPAAALDDPWEAFEALILGTCELQAGDRAVADLLGMRFPHTPTVMKACNQVMDRFVDIIERGRREGALRDDVVLEDVGPILWSSARILEAGDPVATPDAWRRHLGFVLDGLRGPARPRPAKRPRRKRPTRS